VASYSHWTEADLQQAAAVLVLVAASGDGSVSPTMAAGLTRVVKVERSPKLPPPRAVAAVVAVIGL